MAVPCWYGQFGCSAAFTTAQAADRDAHEEHATAKHLKLLRRHFLKHTPSVADGRKPDSVHAFWYARAPQRGDKWASTEFVGHDGNRVSAVLEMSKTESQGQAASSTASGGLTSCGFGLQSSVPVRWDFTVSVADVETGREIVRQKRARLLSRESDRYGVHAHHGMIWYTSVEDCWPCLCVSSARRGLRFSFVWCKESKNRRGLCFFHRYGWWNSSKKRNRLFCCKPNQLLKVTIVLHRPPTPSTPSTAKSKGNGNERAAHFGQRWSSRSYTRAASAASGSESHPNRRAAKRARHGNT